MHIYDSGNQITKVLEDADPVTTNGSMDYAGATGQEAPVEYNEWGAMTRDDSRNISSISYDNLGNPLEVRFGTNKGEYARYVYSANGERLKAEHYTNLSIHVNPVVADGLSAETNRLPQDLSSGEHEIAGLSKYEYHGPVVYRNGKVDMVRFPGGYATIKDGEVTFHYYTQDYLGSNRAVINGSTGAVEQTVAYYPYGAVIADLGTGASVQRFKFGGKELTLHNGLNEYDFGARQYYPAVPHFTSVDPLCEKTPGLSPYLYCGNNPVNSVDPNGEDIWNLDSSGHIINVQSFDQFDMLTVVDQQNRIKNSWIGDYGTISKQFSKGNPSQHQTFSGFEINGDKAGTEIFEFLADNTSVEWSHLKTGDNADNSANYVSTTHLKGEDASAYIMITERLKKTPIREYIHNHPSNKAYPSGMEPRDTSGDLFFARWLDKINPISATYKIYTPTDREYYYFNSYSTKDEFNVFYINLPECKIIGKSPRY